MANFRRPFLSTINAFRKLLLFTFKTEVSIHVGLQNKVQYYRLEWNGSLARIDASLLYRV